MVFLAVAAGSAFTYSLLFLLNEYLFDHFAPDQHVDIIFLPAGVRLLLVLIGRFPAAVGIAVASATLWLSVHEIKDLDEAILVGLASGMTPYLVTVAMEKFGRISPTLQQFHAKDLVLASFLFAFSSSLVHQLLFLWLGLDASIMLWIQMMVGDLLGSFICLWIVYYGFQFIRFPRIKT